MKCIETTSTTNSWLQNWYWRDGKANKTNRTLLMQWENNCCYNVVDHVIWSTFFFCCFFRLHFQIDIFDEWIIHRRWHKFDYILYMPALTRSRILIFCLFSTHRKHIHTHELWMNIFTAPNSIDGHTKNLQQQRTNKISFIHLHKRDCTRNESRWQ